MLRNSIKVISSKNYAILLMVLVPPYFVLQCNELIYGPSVIFKLNIQNIFSFINCIIARGLIQSSHQGGPTCLGWNVPTCLGRNVP